DVAREHGHSAITPAHLVLGLLTEPDALAAKALADQRVTGETLRTAATAALPEDGESGTAPDLPPFSAEAKKALELTYREALRLGHNYIGTEHVLLALLEHEDDDGVLTAAGVTKARVETFVNAALAELVARRSDS
ncbi:Clp protease N-terminal domain-containing protein, partial [Prauserella alba]